MSRRPTKRKLTLRNNPLLAKRPAPAAPSGSPAHTRAGGSAERRQQVASAAAAAPRGGGTATLTVRAPTLAGGAGAGSVRSPVAGQASPFDALLLAAAPSDALAAVQYVCSLVPPIVPRKLSRYEQLVAAVEKRDALAAAEAAGADDVEAAAAAVERSEVAKRSDRKFLLVTGVRFALTTQIYAVVPDRTSVDRELERLRTSGEVLLMRAATPEMEIAVVLRSEYDKFLADRCDALETEMGADSAADESVGASSSATAEPASSRRVAEARTILGAVRALRVLIASRPDMSFKAASFDRRLDNAVRRRELPEGTPPGRTARATLVQCGLLTRRMDNPHVEQYWLTVPESGPALRYLVKGRQELIANLRRTKFKEVSRKALEARRLSRSPLPMELHILDAVGAGVAEFVGTGRGAVVRLAKRHRDT